MNEELNLKLLSECGINAKANGKGELPLQFCPFHEHHFRSPSLQINVKKGVYYCYSCHCSGSLRRIFYHFGLVDEYANKVNTEQDFEKCLTEILTSLEMPEEEKNNAQIDEMKDWRFIHNYMLQRGFSKELIIKNKIGYNKESARVTIPIFFKGQYYGSIQRTVLNVQPRYIYPRNLQKSAIIYSPKPLQVRNNDIEIWVEGSLDALKLAQYGFIAHSILGCHISKAQLQIMEKSSKEQVLAFDNDQPGKDGMFDVLQRTNRNDVSILQLPERFNDVCETPENELLQSLENRKHRLEYLLQSM